MLQIHMPIPIADAAELKRRREYLQLTQQDMAYWLGIGRVAVAKLESGASPLTLRTAKAAAVVFAFLTYGPVQLDPNPLILRATARGQPTKTPPAHKSLFFNLNLEPVAWEAIRDAAPGTRYWAEKVPRGALERGSRLLYIRSTGVTGDDPVAGASLTVPALPIPTAARPSTYVMADLSSFPIERHAELRAMQHADMVALERSINPDGPEPVPVAASVLVPAHAMVPRPLPPFDPKDHNTWTNAEMKTYMDHGIWPTR